MGRLLSAALSPSPRKVDPQSAKEALSIMTDEMLPERRKRSRLVPSEAAFLDGLAKAAAEAVSVDATRADGRETRRRKRQVPPAAPPAASEARHARIHARRVRCESAKKRVRSSVGSAPVSIVVLGGGQECSELERETTPHADRSCLSLSRNFELAL